MEKISIYNHHYDVVKDKYYLCAGRVICKNGMEAFAITEYSDAKKAMSHCEKDCLAHYMVDILNGVKVSNFETYYKHYMKN